MSPKQRIEKWLNEAVVGLSLCPFAKPYTLDNSIKFISSCAFGIEDCVKEIFSHIAEMDQAKISEISNTLIVYDEMFERFEDFLDLINISTETLENTELSMEFQLAYFHPDFVFQGSQPQSKENFTARSPYPAIHILRASLVEAARRASSDIDLIPERNIKKVSSLDPETLSKVFLHK